MKVSGSVIKILAIISGALASIIYFLDLLTDDDTGHSTLLDYAYSFFGSIIIFGGMIFLTFSGIYFVGLGIKCLLNNRYIN